MTTPSDRPSTDEMVLDVRCGVVADAHQRDAVVANIRTLVDEGRAEGMPIVWVSSGASTWTSQRPADLR